MTTPLSARDRAAARWGRPPEPADDGQPLNVWEHYEQQAAAELVRGAVSIEQRLAWAARIDPRPPQCQ
ncbi:hypothetical protein [Cellulomonas sp. KRMCY2]|uniref:hypothetical protein n=1 Tax=Cellulomonas sp. KRMCY2 TaxID=1304865 RepID=UPI00045E6894|nr:hypothetical protein [Cellulomonas sp. KRMCY2]